MTPVHRAVAVLALAVLLAAGCAHQPTGTPAAAPATSAATPTVQVAAAQYLKLVAPYNKALDEYKAAAKKVGLEKPFENYTSRDIRVIAEAASKLADANRAFGIGLQEASWPANATKAVESLAAETARDQSPLRMIAKAKTAAELETALTAYHERQDSGSAELLRQQLGLQEAGN